MWYMYQFVCVGCGLTSCNIVVQLGTVSVWAMCCGQLEFLNIEYIKMCYVHCVVC